MIALCKFLFLFVFGGSIYYGIEMFTRGFSHWSMFILGGICFILCGRLNEKQRGRYTLLQQMFLSMLMITFLEFCAGVILNLWLKLDIWDYSRIPLIILDIGSMEKKNHLIAYSRYIVIKLS